MNQDDRRALVEMGRQFVPHLYQHVSEGAQLADEVVLGLVAETLAFLAQASQPDPALPLPQDGVDPATLARLLNRERVRYHDHQAVETDSAEAGGRRRRLWRPITRAATVDDVQAMTLTPGGQLALVVKDGKSYTFDL